MVLGGSWAVFGTPLAGSRTDLGGFWGSWAPAGATWTVKMEPSWREERPRRAKLGQVGAKMGPSWGQVGPSWVQNDPKRAPREAKLSFRGPSWSIWGQVEGEGGDLLESYVFPRENLYFGESGGSFWRLLGAVLANLGARMCKNALKDSEEEAKEAKDRATTQRKTPRGATRS